MMMEEESASPCILTILFLVKMLEAIKGRKDGSSKVMRIGSRLCFVYEVAKHNPRIG